ncbi:MarR family transcriptional regulator [Curtobacterium sp. MCBD17_034]|nr:MarR family transcriptional regulator [Curtobacterium sp. MCBD17_034]PZM39734.1 MarR family transcriptional regulator [Curtobacterium sp. MCBD17_031]
MSSMSEPTTQARGFWDGASPASVTDVLEALRQLREAEQRAHRRACASLHVGENGLHALRFLLEAGAVGQDVNAKDLAVRLGVTAASTSVLVERLVRSGYVERHPDPQDRRGVLLTATGPAAHRARRVIAELDATRGRAVTDLPAGAADVVLRFLTEMADAVGAEDSVPAGMDNSS